MALWIIATPIGTLGDLSPRAREVLGAVSVIAAEDTRRTRQLLSAMAIPAPEMVALHAHNESERAAALAQRALGEDVALVSDAGTPGISDPGVPLVAAAHALGCEIRSVPGPSSLVAAIAASGFVAAPMTFLGFAPRRSRSTWVEEALRRPETWVVFEAPGRVQDLVRQLAAVAPDREACLCRELSKKFEQVLRAPLSALASTLAEVERVRGECVLVIGPGTPFAAAAPTMEGEGLRDVAAVLASRWGVSKREAYQALLELEREMSADAP